MSQESEKGFTRQFWLGVSMWLLSNSESWNNSGVGKVGGGQRLSLSPRALPQSTLCRANLGFPRMAAGAPACSSAARMLLHPLPLLFESHIASLPSQIVKILPSFKRKSVKAHPLIKRIIKKLQKKKTLQTYFQTVAFYYIKGTRFIDLFHYSFIHSP